MKKFIVSLSVVSLFVSTTAFTTYGINNNNNNNNTKVSNSNDGHKISNISRRLTKLLGNNKYDINLHNKANFDENTLLKYFAYNKSKNLIDIDINKISSITKNISLVDILSSNEFKKELNDFFFKRRFLYKK